MFSPDNEKRLLELLEREFELFKKILELTGEQTELLTADDADAFNKSLDVRQALIEEINGLHQESDILMQSYMSVQEQPGGDRAGEIEAAAARLRDVIAQSAAINEKNTVAAKDKAEEYIRQIGKLSLNRKSIGAYIQGVPNEPEHFDKKT